MEACTFTGIPHRDVTRFQKPPFSYIHMSAAKWQVQNLYTESVSEKDAFSMAIFTWYMWTVGQNQKKISVFKQQWICVDGASCWSATNIYMGKLHVG